MAAKGRTSEALSSIQSERQNTSHEIRVLRKQVEHQRDLLQGLWMMLKEKLDLADDDWRAAIRVAKEHADLTDSSADLCSNCSRPLQKDSNTCIYCGTETETDEPLF